MLELRPSCEHCRRALPPHSAEARICSFECTFCADCVREVLQGICPNCGGNFVPRPIRPRQAWNRDNSLVAYPAGTRVVERPVDAATQAELVGRLKDIPPGGR